MTPTPTPASVRICLMGAPISSGNRGVLALGAATIGLLLHAFPDAEIKLLTGNNNNAPYRLRHKGEYVQIPVVNKRMSPRSKPNEHMFWILSLSLLYRFLPINAVRSAIARTTPWIRAVREADFVADIRGGDSFSDIYGLGKFISASLPRWSVLLVKGSMVHLPQTYGPFRSPVARSIAVYMLRKAPVIIARDTKSRDAAASLLDGDMSRLRLSPDVAFSLEPILPPSISFSPPINEMPSNAIGINVNGLMYHGGYSRNNMFGLKMDYANFLESLCVRLLNETDRRIVLIPHTFAPAGDVESDNAACLSLRESLSAHHKDRVWVVDQEYDQFEIKAIIGKCDFFIGSRMHSCIAALSQGVPCVGVAYSMKFSGVFDSVGMKDWVVDARTASDSEATDRIEELYLKRDEIRDALAKNAWMAKEKLYQTFGDLLKTQIAATTR